jgi:hypothetical protein
MTEPTRLATRLALDRITCDPALQSRAELDRETVGQYAEAMRARARFPAVVVYHDGDLYWLSQGFHRIAGAREAGRATIEAEVREGTRDDALWDAACSNREHDTAGLRRTNADKRRAARMAIEARPKLSDNRIAKEVGVSDHFVGKVRQELSPIGSEIGPRTVTRGGTTYEMDVGNIGRREATGAAKPASDGRAARSAIEPDGFDDEGRDDEDLDTTGSATFKTLPAVPPIPDVSSEDFPAFDLSIAMARFVRAYWDAWPEYHRNRLFAELDCFVLKMAGQYKFARAQTVEIPH